MPLEYEEKGGILHVCAIGKRTREAIIRFVPDIYAACAEKKLSKVLLDIRGLEGRLPIREDYDIPSRFFPTVRNLNVINRAALVDLKEFERDDAFFETVAVNRGFNLRIFSNSDEALQWLIGQ